jgi:hypothetical protein
LLLPRKQRDAIGWRRNGSVQGNLLRVNPFATYASSANLRWPASQR